ncbi:hypothetical protein DsansV1_C23g0177101 [Dioscorea sansibarensis]
MVLLAVLQRIQTSNPRNGSLASTTNISGKQNASPPKIAFKSKAYLTTEYKRPRKKDRQGL